MDFFEVIAARHSIRRYAETPVEEEKLQAILETSNKAPSAGDLQGYEIYVVRSLEQRRELVTAAGGQAFMAEAPVTLVFCANPARSAVWYKKRGTSLYSLQDATIACTYAMLSAKALGLDTVWVGAFDEAAVREVLRIPPDLKPVALLPIGYAAKSARITPRRELSDIVHEA